MSLARTLVLGFIAGATIVLGLPVGRLRHPAERLRALLSALAVGVLIFLVVDVFANALAPVQDALAAVHRGAGHPARAILYVALLLAGTAVGLLALVLVGRRPRRGGAAPSARELSLMIASGIGLHNFGEGLAIGASARSGALGLSTVLVVGFALHNATEGFGIVSPLAGAERRPGWGFLALAALIGGGPTTIGTLVGWVATSTALRILFLALAGGSIVYVVGQILFVLGRSRHATTVYVGITAGLLAGFATDLVVSLAGG